MKEKELETKNENTWCPGCTNFLMKSIVQKTIGELPFKKEGYCIVTDIGCNSKIYDYLALSGINGLHGRAIPTAFGIQLGNPNMKTIVFAGDGAVYAEGLEHFIHTCRSNINITLLVMNNEVFALTIGQPTPTTELNFRDKTTPAGVKEKQLNPIALALISGATFVARMNLFDMENAKEILKEALKHPGFAFIDVIQPCIKFHDISKIIREKAYKVSPSSFDVALKLAEEHLGHSEKIPYGIFYKINKESFEEKRGILKKLLGEKRGFGEKRKQKNILKDFLD